MQPTNGIVIQVHVIFLLTHPLRGATKSTDDIKKKYQNFYSHTPCGVQHCDSEDNYIATDFYSHTPCGVQRRQMYRGNGYVQFLLTHPLRGATHQTELVDKPFLLTHPLRGATDDIMQELQHQNISTHTPLAGCNTFIADDIELLLISTHTPLAGCNPSRQLTKKDINDFYSHTPCGVQRNTFL